MATNNIATQPLIFFGNSYAYHLTFHSLTIVKKVFNFMY